MDSNEKIKLLEDKLDLLKAFSKHSFKGFKCSECNRFIPNSYEGIKCPYPSCKEVFDIEVKIEKKHPVTFGKRRFVYINNVINKNGTGDQKEFSEKYCDDGGNAYDLLSQQEEKVNEFTMIRSVISGQKKANGNTRKIPIKASMYDAFEAVLNELPEETTKYLINGGQNGDVSIQAIIFQTFADIIEAKLPIVVFMKGVQVRIESLLDERLHIFEGKRQFVNFLDHNLIIKKKSQLRINEDGSTVKDNTDHFIGKIISIKDANGEDLKHLVDSYSFSNIKMKNCQSLKAGTDITVEYFSLKPSYTMGSLIHLQRIKKKLSDSIKRKIG